MRLKNKQIQCFSMLTILSWEISWKSGNLWQIRQRFKELNFALIQKKKCFPFPGLWETLVTYVAMPLAQLFGSSWQSGFYASVDAVYSHCDDLALFSGKLREDFRLEAAQHQTLLQQQLQLPKVRRARVVPAPGHLEEGGGGGQGEGN